MRRKIPHGVLATAVGALGLALASPSADAAKVLIDFGASGTATTSDSQSRTWNNVNDGNDLTGSPFTLNATTGSDSGYRLTVSNPPGTTNAIGFNGANSNGVTGATTPAGPTGTALARGYPTSATGDSLYGNTVTFGNGIVQSVTLTLTNLNPAEQYDLDFFASRMGAGGDNRQTEYAVAGGNGTASALLNASENTGNITGVTGLTPDGNNQIVITIDRGPANNNGSGFFYLGVMEINSSPVPEPASLGLAGIAAAGLLLRRRRPVGPVQRSVHMPVSGPA